MKPRANKRQQKRAAAQEFWCSWGRHTTFKHRLLKEQYPAGTICFGCQLEIMQELEKVVYMPEMSEAMYRHQRQMFEQRRNQALIDAHLERQDATGWVYYFRINGHVKIGYTSNLRNRSKAYPPGSVMLAVEPGTPGLERERHAQFRRYLAKGREWFVESPELQEHMTALVEQHGRPEKLMYKYRTHRAAREGETVA